MNNKIKQTLAFLSLIYHRIAKKNAPLFVALGITNKCNYKCSYCYGDYYNQKEENFKTEELLKIINDLKKAGTRVINLIGGEPLLREDLGILVDKINNLNMICTISTNASLAPSKIDILKKIDYMDTSLDGVEINNDKNRGQGTYQKTLNGIRAAVKNKIKTNVNMVLTKHNLDDIDSMVLLAKEEGFTLSFNIAFEAHSKEYSNFEQTQSIKNQNDAKMRNALTKILDYKQKGFPIRFSKSAYEYAYNWPLSYSGQVYAENYKELLNFKPIKCLLLKYQLYIDTDGSMNNCMHIKDKMPQINVKNIGVNEGWKKIQESKAPCLACYTICNNDFNFLLNLKPSTIVATFLNFK